MTIASVIIFASRGMPRLNEVAPAFEAVTTHGVRKLSDYKGEWLILFSHPADFTPVCPTEFIGFARAQDQFAVLNTELLGLSIDSKFAHIARVRSTRDNFGADVRFPTIENLSMRVAHAYGMVMPGASDTSAVRATFIIDPNGILRATVYDLMSNGCSVNEFLRLVEALQTADANKVTTPENWQPGEPVIVPPPKTAGAADACKGEGFDYADWRFSRKTLQNRRVDPSHVSGPPAPMRRLE